MNEQTGSHDVKTTPNITRLEAPLESLSATLLPHQVDGLNFLIDHERALLADDVGLGKTVQALAYAGELLGFDPDCRILVLTEAAVVPQWMAEITRFLPGVSARPLSFAARWQFPVSITVTSYDTANRRRDDLAREPFRLVILDEVSAVKGGGKTFDTVRHLTQPSGRLVVGLTATPLENSPVETYRILEAIGTPDLFSRKEFRSMLVFNPPYQLKKGATVPESFRRYAPGGAEKFSAYLNGISLRRTADEINLPLPVRVGREVFWVPLTGPQGAAHARAANRQGLPGHQARQRAGRMIAGQSVLLDAAVAFLRPRVSAEKAILYAENKNVLDKAGEVLDTLGIGWVRIDGEVIARARTSALERFRTDHSVRVLLGSSSLERGLNLQHCRLLVSLDCSYNPAREDQREGRIRRIGSPHDTYEHTSFLPDTQDARLKWQRLQDKRRHAAAVGM